MNIQNYDTLLNNMMNYMKANQDKITDFNEGSICRTIFESIARCVERTYIDVRNGYSNNLKEIPYALFDFHKKAGSYANVEVIFSRNTPIPRKTIIPVGTQISDGTHIYITTSIGEIKENELDSNGVTARAEELGIDYNVIANSINIIESAISSDVVKVNNPFRAENGANEETDMQLEERFKSYINGLQGTNSYGFKSAILAVDGVRSVSIVEQFPAYLNIYNAIVYVDDGTGNLSLEMKQKIQDVINGKDNSVYPGCRASGIQVLIDSASPVPLSLDVWVKVYRTDDETATFDVREVLTEEINNLKIGESVIISSLILRLRRISYIKDVVELTISDGTEKKTQNLEIRENQIARISSGAINVKVTSVTGE